MRNGRPACASASPFSQAAVTPSSSSQSAMSASSAAAIPPLSAAQESAVHTALAQLSSALAQGELPDAPLYTLGEILPAHALQALHHAIDSFNFSDAQRCLDALEPQVQTLPNTAL